MGEGEYLTILYDYYGELFNARQRDYFEWYYFDNLSLSEIAINENKSRNAVHKCIKNVCNKLYEYEKVLKLYEKRKKIEDIMLRIDDDKIKRELDELL